MKIHHVGYYVLDIKRARNIFSMMGFDEESEQIYDEERGINVLFLTNGENRIELIEKCTEESDVDFIAKGKRSMPYHICYEVNNMEESVDFLKQNRFIVIKKPSNAIAIQNRRVAFLYCKECGLIELVEK